MENSTDTDFLFFRDWQANHLKRIGSELWIEIFLRRASESEKTSVYTALIPNHKVDQVFQDASWDLSIGSGLPSCTKYYTEDGEQVVYHRFGNQDGIEPIIMYRDFHGIRPNVIELQEEFRYFHNLFHDIKNNQYIKIGEGGNEEVVVRLENGKVSARLKEVRQFLAIKEMCLAVYFDIDRFSSVAISSISQDQRMVEYREDLLFYRISVSEYDFPSKSGVTSFSRLLGKKIIPGFSKNRSGIWPYKTEEERYVEYIIGQDLDGQNIYYSSNPDLLGNYYGANPNAPQYLTPVFFHREVMIKYFSSPGRYSVEDNYLRCGGLWGLCIDNNHPEYIIVFLGDLGRDLSYEEQLYWRSFNILPDGAISTVNYRRSFLAEFTDPEQVDLIFKMNYENFQERWFKNNGWYLFRPLSQDDKYLFDILRIPLLDEQIELDSQVLALTKLLIDSLNEEEIEKATGGSDLNIKGGISKFQKYLESNAFPETESKIKFLRNLQSLRSAGVGHRKGEKYTKIAKDFNLDTQDIVAVFAGILNDAVSLLIALSAHFLPS
jgi:hypothetical protein